MTYLFNCDILKKLLLYSIG